MSCCWDCNLIKHNRIAGLDPGTEIETSLFHPVKVHGKHLLGAKCGQRNGENINRPRYRSFDEIKSPYLGASRTRCGRAGTHLNKLQRLNIPHAPINRSRPHSRNYS